jgi:hypothetical protein
MLDELITSDRIKQFYRPSEERWVTLGVDKIRKARVKKHKGPERRRPIWNDTMTSAAKGRRLEASGYRLQASGFGMHFNHWACFSWLFISRMQTINVLKSSSSSRSRKSRDTSVRKSFLMIAKRSVFVMCLPSMASILENTAQGTMSSCMEAFAHLCFLFQPDIATILTPIRLSCHDG